MTLRSLPNLVTALRLLLVPLVVAAALAGAPAWLVLALMATCFFTDLVDGLLARWLDAVSATGARLDSLADFVFYMSIPLTGWLVWPELLEREALWFLGALISIVLPSAVAFAKFRLSSGYHTWLAKTSALCMGLGVLVLFGSGHGLLFRFSVVLALLAAAEELAITAVLRAPREDVRSLWHVLRDPPERGTAP